MGLIYAPTGLEGMGYSCDEVAEGMKALSKSACALAKVDIDDWRWRKPQIKLDKPLKKFPDNPRRYKK